MKAREVTMIGGDGGLMGSCECPILGKGEKVVFREVLPNTIQISREELRAAGSHFQIDLMLSEIELLERYLFDRKLPEDWDLA